MPIGLSSRFTLDKGKFHLDSGKDKYEDNVWFFCTFDLFRVYFSDFGAKFSRFLQKPSSFFVTNKTLIEGNLQTGLEKYVPGVTLKAFDVGYIGNDRKNYHFRVMYSAKDDNVETDQVTFV